MSMVHRSDLKVAMRCSYVFLLAFVIQQFMPQTILTFSAADEGRKI